MASSDRWTHLLGASWIKARIRSDESLAISNQTMTTSASYREVSSHAVKRIASIDIFRGLNVMLMILFNNLSVVAGLPWWTYHRGDVNGMTHVDMVFPGFLFLMGMSIPLSLEALPRTRTEQGSDLGACSCTVAEFGGARAVHCEHGARGRETHAHE